MEIIKANLKHLNIILNINKNDNELAFNENILKKELSSNNHLYFIILDNNKVLGYISCSISIDSADITNVLIDKNYRNKRLSKKLFNHLYNYLKSIHIYNIFLEVKTTNHIAINLYKSENFILIDTRKKYYSDKTDAYIFKKQIN